MEDEKLKTCPFCGGEAELKTANDGWRVRCTKCTCNIVVFSKYSKNVIEKWNTRTESEK